MQLGTVNPYLVCVIEIERSICVTGICILILLLFYVARYTYVVWFKCLHMYVGISL